MNAAAGMSGRVDGDEAISTVTAVIPVFRDATRAIAAAAALNRQRLPAGTALHVVVVDDGSGDDTADRIASAFGQSLHVLRLATNVGRSAARNAGAAHARGDFLVFMDCDCEPQGDEFLINHLRSLAASVASVGPVHGDGGGFWDSYQRRSSRRRERAFGRGETYAGSTQNLAVRRKPFVAIGGFDEAYGGYGFEDRDLLLRLARTGSIAWTGSALVHHLDTLSLAEICEKMRQAGAGNAGVFRAAHPDAYRRLGYAAMDASLHPARGALLRLVAPVLPWMARASDARLEARWLPLPLRMAWVRLLSAASFGAGTLRRG